LLIRGICLFYYCILFTLKKEAAFLKLNNMEFILYMYKLFFLRIFFPFYPLSILYVILLILSLVFQDFFGFVIYCDSAISPTDYVNDYSSDIYLRDSYLNSINAEESVNERPSLSAIHNEDSYKVSCFTSYSTYQNTLRRRLY